MNKKILYTFFFTAFLFLGIQTIDVQAAEAVEDLEPGVEETIPEDTSEEEINPESGEEGNNPEEDEEEYIVPEVILDPGFQKYEDYYVIADEDGHIQKGRTIFEGYTYILNADTGAIQYGFVRDGDNAYYCDAFGHVQTGNFIVDKVEVTTDKTGNILFSVEDGVPYFCQKDSKWSSTKIGGYTIGSTGCAINVLCSIYNYLTDSNITPVTLGKEMYEAGYYNKVCQGTLGTAFEYFCEVKGFSYIALPNIEDARVALKSGYLIAAGVGGPCKYVNAGYCHEILLFGYNMDDTTNVYDPNKQTNNGLSTLTYIYDNASWGAASIVDGCTFFGIGLKNLVESAYEVTSKELEYHVGNQMYTGYACVPELVVTYKDVHGQTKRLIEGKDYKIIEIKNNVEVGQATVVIQGMGKLTGIKMVRFDVVDTSLQDGTYKIAAADNSKIVLHDPYASTKIGEIYCVYAEVSGTYNRQLFEINRLENGYYTIKNVASGLYLTNGNVHSVEDSISLRQTSYEVSKDLMWMLESVGGVYIISSAWDRNYVLDIDCAVLGSDKDVILSKRTESPLQKWNIKTV